MNSAIRARREAEDGFTLIELLVVVIIIGILAAIAIPAFLNQRERAWQAELTSAVRNASLDIEAEATAAGGAYPGTDDGDTTATDFVTDNVGAINCTTGPICDVVYLAFNSAGTALTGTTEGTGFRLCMEHALINNGTNNVTYQGGSEGNGLLPFAEAAC